MFVPEDNQQEVSYGAGLNMINALDVSDEFISNQKPTPSPTWYTRTHIWAGGKLQTS